MFESIFDTCYHYEENRVAEGHAHSARSAVLSAAA